MCCETHDDQKVSHLIIADGDNAHDGYKVNAFGEDGGGSILVPAYYDIRHRPVGSVDQEDVEALIDEGMLREFDVRIMSRYNGSAVGIMCCDPSLLAHKSKLFNRDGNMSIMSLPGMGLRFDPDGIYPNEVEFFTDLVRAFIEGEAGEFFSLSGIFFGAHFPCKASKSLSLRSACLSIVAGTHHLKKSGIQLDIIPTIFINMKVVVTRGSSPQYVLKWFGIH